MTPDQSLLTTTRIDRVGDEVAFTSRLRFKMAAESRATALRSLASGEPMTIFGEAWDRTTTWPLDEKLAIFEFSNRGPVSEYAPIRDAHVTLLDDYKENLAEVNGFAEIVLRREFSATSQRT